MLRYAQNAIDNVYDTISGTWNLVINSLSNFHENLFFKIIDLLIRSIYESRNPVFTNFLPIFLSFEKVKKKSYNLG